MRPNFADRFMSGHQQLDIGFLFPTTQMMPNSSLAHYLNLAVPAFGTPGSGHLVSEDGTIVRCRFACRVLENFLHPYRPPPGGF